MQILHRNVVADVRIGHELHTFGSHLLEAAIDDVFFQLELWDTIAQQAADAIRLFVHVTQWPARFNCCAAANPAGPEPTMATFFRVRNFGGSG